MTPHLRARAAHAQVLSGEVVGLSVVELAGERPAGVLEPQCGRPRIGGPVSHDDTQVSSAPRVSAQTCRLATLSPRARPSHSIVLVEAERLHAHFPIPVGPGHTVAMELGIGFGANFPLIDDANV